MTRSISSDDLAVQLVAGEPAARRRARASGVTVSSLRAAALARIAPATSPTPVIARALQPQRHAHRPRRQPPAPLGAHVDEAGIVELHPRRGQPVGIIGASRTARRASTPCRTFGRSCWGTAPAAAAGRRRAGRRGSGCRRGRPRRASTARSAGEASVSWPSSIRSSSVRVAAHAHDRRGQPLQLALEELRRRPSARRAGSGRCRRPARAARSAGRTGRARRCPRQRRPAAVAVDGQVDRALGADQRRQQPVGRRHRRAASMSKRSRSGSASSLQREPVAAVVDRRVELDQRPARRGCRPCRAPGRCAPAR